MSATETTQELLPCPFCGHDKPSFERTGTGRHSCIVACGNCGARHESSDEYERSGESWNTRARVTAAPLEGEALARQFHEAYERLAPSFVYETRPETRAFESSSPNGQLMIAVCREMALPPGRGMVPMTTEQYRKLFIALQADKRSAQFVASDWFAGGVAMAEAHHGIKEGS